MYEDRCRSIKHGLQFIRQLKTLEILYHIIRGVMLQIHNWPHDDKNHTYKKKKIINELFG